MLTDKFGDLVILVVVFVIPFFLFFILRMRVVNLIALFIPRRKYSLQ